MSLPIKDATSNGSGTGATVTVAHTVTNSHSNLGLIVSVENDNSTDNITATYAGVSMNKLGSVPVSGSGTLDLFQLLSPTTGTNNIVASQGSTNTAEVCGISYYNVTQSSTFGTVATNSGAGTSSTNTVATTSLNQLVLDALTTFSVTSVATPPTGETTETSNALVSYTAIGDIPLNGKPHSSSWASRAAR